MSIKPLFDDSDPKRSSSAADAPDTATPAMPSPDEPSHPRNRAGRNAPDGGDTGYEKNSPDGYSSRVPDPLERRAAEQLGEEERAQGYVWSDDSTERSGPEKRLDEDESGL